MKEGKNHTVMLTIVGIATLLVAVVGATFAYFSAIVSGNDTVSSIVIGTGTASSEFVGNAQLKVENAYPQENALNELSPAKFSVTKTGGSEMKYEVSIVTDVNTKNPNTENAVYEFLAFDNDDLQAKIVNKNTSVLGTTIDTVTKDIETTQSARTILGYGIIPLADSGVTTTHQYELLLYFPNDNSDQNKLQGATWNGHIEIRYYDAVTNSYK